VVPVQRLTELLLRTGNWSGALSTLRTWEALLVEPVAKAEIWLRIGFLLRDHGRDKVQAAGLKRRLLRAEYDVVVESQSSAAAAC